MTQTNLQNRKRLTDLENELMVGAERMVRESGMDMDSLLYLTWRTSKDLLDSTGSSAQCHMAVWMGGELGEKGHMCMCGGVPLLST